MDTQFGQEYQHSARRVAVVIVAAGRGERAGQSSEGPKQYRLIGKKPVIRHTLEVFASHDGISAIAVAIHPDDHELFASASAGLGREVLTVNGGATRQTSTHNALQALKDIGPDIVLIHDAVRPFVDHGLIDRVVGAVSEANGALPAVAVSDTLKRADDDMFVVDTISREGVFSAQTPQGFPFSEILAIHERAAELGLSDFTDDAAIAEWGGMRVRLVEGSSDNIKLTWADDLVISDQRLGGRRMGGLPDVRTGNGYDVHSFAEGDHVVLCGVKIPHSRKLTGHSDADVGLHALTDALLATRGAGDIGTHFPPSDPQWKDASSHTFTEYAVQLVRKHGGRIANADITFICEAPKIGPYREAMRAELSRILGISPERISVKASTNEKLGFIGRSEGIAAIATATVVYPDSLPD